MAPVHLTLEGNIGSGKSTLLRAIEATARPDELRVLQEPVHEWDRPVLPGGQSMLQAFYADPDRHAAAFQAHVLMTRLRQTLDASRDVSCRAILAERCIESGMEVFGMEQRDAGRIDDVGWATYCGWNELATSLCRDAGMAPVNGVVYLRCTPRTNVNRVLMRGRTAESGVSPDYLSRLHERHEAWVQRMREAGVRVLVLDGDLEGPDAVRRHATDVVEWIRGLVC